MKKVAFRCAKAVRSGDCQRNAGAGGASFRATTVEARAYGRNLLRPFNFSGR